MATQTQNKCLITPLPSCPASIDRITQLYDAGVCMFRLNLSHVTHDWHAQLLADLNALRAQFDKHCADRCCDV